MGANPIRLHYRASELRIFSALSHHHQLKMSAIARLSVSPRLAMAWMRPASAQATSLLHTSSAKQDIDSAAKLSELEPPPSESLDPELVSDLCSDPSSSVTPGTPPSSSSFSPTLSLDLPCPRPWVCSV